tara:strand:+ start:3971 stop:4567 length:597 start_codon:yes stop_codon:yes gene_type:complete
MNTQQIRTDLFNIIATLDKDPHGYEKYLNLFGRYATMALEHGAYYETLWAEMEHVADTYKIREMDDLELGEEILSDCRRLMKGFEDDDPRSHGAVVDLITKDLDARIGHHLHYGHYILSNFYSHDGYWDNCYHQLMAQVEMHVQSNINKPAEPDGIAVDFLTGIGKMVKGKLETGDFETVNIGLTEESSTSTEGDDYW